MKSLLIILIIVLSYSICFTQSINNFKSIGWESGVSTIKEDNLNVKTTTEQKFKVGLNSGYHFQNLDESYDFTGDLLFELYIGFILSHEVSILMGFSYWKAKTLQAGNPEYLIPSESIISKAFKLGFEFSLIKIYDASLLLEPLVSIGGLTTATNAIFAFGADLKMRIPLWQERINILTSANYQNGSELLNFGGSRIHYSFFAVTIGLEIFL